MWPRGGRVGTSPPPCGQPLGLRAQAAEPHAGWALPEGTFCISGGETSQGSVGGKSGSRGILAAWF